MTDDCEHLKLIELMDSKMIVTKDATKISILMGLTIMQASKNFKINKLLRIFGRSNSISKTLVKHMNSWGETNPWCV